MMKVVGIQKVHYERDGIPVDGVRVFLSHPQDDTDGVVVENEYISSRYLKNVSFDVGDEVQGFLYVKGRDGKAYCHGVVL